MPELNGIEATRQIVRAEPARRRARADDVRGRRLGLRRHARGRPGYLLKGADQDDIVRAIAAVGRGEAIFGPDIARRVIEYFTVAAREPRRAGVPRADRARARGARARSPQGHNNAGIAAALRAQPEDGPQPRLEHLHQAPGGRPRRRRSCARARPAWGSNRRSSERRRAWTTRSACCPRPSRPARCAPGTCSARELVAAHLARIERIDPLVNAIVTRTPERALAAADEADRRRARGDELPPLHGLPIAHKDLQDTAGVRTTYGSPSYPRPRAGQRLAAGRAAARGGRDPRGQDQHARVGRRLAHVQPRLRRHAQRLGHDALGGRLERWRRGRAGLPDAADRRRQRPRRLAAQPGRLERRARAAADARASSRAGPWRRPGCRSRSRGRWRAPRPTSPCCSRRMAGPDARDPLSQRGGARPTSPRRSRPACAAGAWPGARRVGGLPIDARRARRAGGRAPAARARRAST